MNRFATCSMLTSTTAAIAAAAALWLALGAAPPAMQVAQAAPSALA